MAKAQRPPATAFASSRPKFPRSRPVSPVLATLAVCGAGGVIAAGILFGVQYTEAPISASASRVLLLLLWLGVFTTLLYTNRRTLSSLGNGASRRFLFGVMFAMIAALVVGLAAMVALTAHVNLGGRL